MKKKMQRITAMLLAMMMVVGLMPTTALAAGSVSGSCTDIVTGEIADGISISIANDAAHPWVQESSGCYHAGNKGVGGTESSLTLTIEVPETSDPYVLRDEYAVSAENKYDYLTVDVNNETVLQTSGDASKTTLAEMTFETNMHVLQAGTNTVKYTFRKDGSGDQGADMAWVRNIGFDRASTFAPEFPALTAPSGIDYSFADLTVAPPHWAPDPNVTDRKAWVSGNVGQDDTTDTMRLTITTDKTCYLAFDYAVSSEAGYDGLRIVQNKDYENGSLLFETGNDSWTSADNIIWTPYQITLASGTTLIDFMFYKDGGSSAGLDQAWLSNFKLIEEAIKTTITVHYDENCGVVQYAGDTVPNGEPFAVPVGNVTLDAVPKEGYYPYSAGYEQGTEALYSGRIDGTWSCVYATAENIYINFQKKLAPIVVNQVEGASIRFTNNAASPWTVDSDFTDVETYIGSGKNTDGYSNQATVLEATVTAPVGGLYLMYETTWSNYSDSLDSPCGNDRYAVLLDRVPNNDYSYPEEYIIKARAGHAAVEDKHDLPWYADCVFIPEGTHTVSWLYADAYYGGSPMNENEKGLDAVWLRNFKLAPAGTDVTGKLTIVFDEKLGSVSAELAGDRAESFGTTYINHPNELEFGNNLSNVSSGTVFTGKLGQTVQFDAEPKNSVVTFEGYYINGTLIQQDTWKEGLALLTYPGEDLTIEARFNGHDFKPMEGVAADDCFGISSIETRDIFPWTASTVDGGLEFASGNQGHGSSVSSLKMVIDKTGALTFDYKVSSEANYDWFAYQLNNEVTEENYSSIESKVSGVQNEWTSVTIPVQAGDSMYFGFRKDSGGESGEDTAWLRNVRVSVGETAQVSVASSDPNCGTVSGSSLEGTMEIGTRPSYTAVPASGCTFFGWCKMDGNTPTEMLSLDETYSFTVTEDISIQAIFAPDGMYAARKGANLYETLGEAVRASQSGDTIILLKDVALDGDLTIPSGVTLLIPCEDKDTGITGSTLPSPDGTSTAGNTGIGPGANLYRTLTIPEGVTLTVEGTLLVNAVVGRPAAGHFDQDVTGGYAQVNLDGKIDVKRGGMLDVFGYVKGIGTVEAQSGGTVSDLYVVRHWRGGSQAWEVYPDVYPMNETDCHNIETPVKLYSGATYTGAVKMYASGSYYYTRFPQVDNANGLLRMTGADGYAVKTYENGREVYTIYGGAAFGESTLNIVGLDLSTQDFIYPWDGDVDFVFHGGTVSFQQDFKFMPGATVTIGDDTAVTIDSGKTVVFYNDDVFHDVPNTDNTQYPDGRGNAKLIIGKNVHVTNNGTFAGEMNFAEDIGTTAVTGTVWNATTKEANGYKNGLKDYSFDTTFVRPNYSGSVADGVLVWRRIPKQTSTVTVTIADWIYGDTESKLQITCSPQSDGTQTVAYKRKGADDSTYDTARPTKAGDYVVRVTYAETETFDPAEQTAEFTISPKTLTPSITGTTTKPYDGNPNANGVLIALDGKVGNDDVSATATFAYNSANVKDANTITATNITLDGTAADNYTLSRKEATAAGQITQAPVTITAATLEPKAYDGTTTATVVDVTFGGLVPGEALKLSTDYTATAEFEDENVGTGKKATVTVTLADAVANYTLASGTFDLTNETITQAASAGKVSPTETSLTYGDTLTVNVSDLAPAATNDNTRIRALTLLPNKLYLCDEDGNELASAGVDGTGGTLEYDTAEKGLEIGDNTLTVQYGGNTNLAANETLGTFTVTLNKKAVTFEPIQATYSGQPYSDSVSLNDTLSGDTVSATVTASSKNAGEYTVNGETNDLTVALDGDHANYYQIDEGTLTITKAPLTITDATLAAKTYNGTKTATVSSVTFSGLVNGERLTLGIDYTATAEFEDENVGTGKKATVTVTLADAVTNYTLTSSTFDLTNETITQADSAGKVVPTETVLTYGDTLTVNVNGITYAEANANLQALTLNQLYLCDEDGNELASAEVDGTGGVLEYDTAEKGLTIGENTLTVQYGGSVNLAANETLGTFTVTLNKKAVTFEPIQATYSGQPYSDSVSLQGVLTGDTVSATVTARGNDVGEYTVNGGDTNGLTVALDGSHADYYQINQGKLTIRKAPLTVQAADQTITYGDDIAEGTEQVTVTGLVGDDTLQSVTLTASSKNVPGGIITPSAVRVNNGEHNVTANYAVDYQDGTLTINKAQPTIHFQDSYQPGKTYDGQKIADPTADALEITGATFADIKFSWSATPRNAGTYLLTAAIPETANTSEATAVLEDIVISPKTLTPAIGGVRVKNYDGTQDPPKGLTITLEGLLVGDDVTALAQSYGYDSVDAGERTITASGLSLTGGDAKNYTLSTETVTGTGRIDRISPVIGTGYALDYITESITVKDGYEVSTAETNGEKISSESISQYLGNTPVTLYIRKLADTNHDASAWIPFTLAARPAAPELQRRNETIQGKQDGALTGLTDRMEYRINGGIWMSGIINSLTDLSAGSVIDVRFQAKKDAPRSLEQQYTIQAGAFLTVTFDANGQAAENMPSNASCSYRGTVAKPKTNPEASNVVFTGWYADKTGGTPWDFGQQLTESCTIYAGWELYKSVTVMEKNGTPVPGAKVVLKQGNVEKGQSSSETDSNGKSNFNQHIPAGVYSVEMTYQGQTITSLVEVVRGQDVTISVTLPETGVNSKLEVEKTADDAKDATSVIAVSGLDEQAAKVKEASTEAAKIEVTMTVKPEKETAIGAQEIRKEVGKDVKLDCLDIQLTKSVNEAKPEPIAEENTLLMEIVIPFDFAGKDKNTITVYRYHAEEAESMRKINGKQDNQEGYWLDENSSLIYIWAKKFSTYAIGYVAEFTVTFDANGGTIPDSTTDWNTNSDGKLEKLPADPTREGYTFRGWYDNDTKVTTNTEFSGNTTVYARWTPEISFDAHGSITEQTTDDTGKLTKLPTPTREDYAFQGWYTPDGKPVTLSTRFTQKTTVYACWTPQITLDANGGTVTGNLKLDTNRENQLTNLPTPTREDYDFQGWCEAKDGSGRKVTPDTIFQEPTTIYAQWTQKKIEETTPPADNPNNNDPNHGGSSSDRSDRESPSYAISTSYNYNSAASSSAGTQEHGKLALSDSSARPGKIVTITVTPDEGYLLDSLRVTDAKKNQLKLTDQGNGTYTFEMPRGKVNVEASFIEGIPEQEHACLVVAFYDLDATAWYHDAIDHVLAKGIMNGYGDGTFGPHETLSRAQLAQILYNQEQRPACTPSVTFPDVAEDAWYSNAVLWAAQRGIVNGYDNGNFGPEDPVTREQMAVMLWRYANNPVASNKQLHFSDMNEAGAYALDALAWAVENHIIQGKREGILDPRGQATRSEAAAMITRYLDDTILG